MRYTTECYKCGGGTGQAHPCICGVTPPEEATPFTDAQEFDTFAVGNAPSYRVVGSGFARSMERELAQLRRQVAEGQATINAVADVFKIGSSARSGFTILANVENAYRRSSCLFAIEDKFFTKLVFDEDENECEDCPLNWGSTPEEYTEQFRSALTSAIAAERAATIEACITACRKHRLDTWTELENYGEQWVEAANNALSATERDIRALDNTDGGSND